MAIKIQGVEVISDAQELTGVKFGTDAITFPSAAGSQNDYLGLGANNALEFITPETRITSASLDANSELTLTRSDATTVTVDLSPLKDDTNTTYSIGPTAQTAYGQLQLTGSDGNNSTLNFLDGGATTIVSNNQGIHI